jgi:hypothetical protein
MSLSYPDPGLDPLVVVPKGVKLKTTLKHIARIAVSSADSHHRARRIYLTNVLERFLDVMKQCPGLVAPRFPQLLCLASLAREEVLSYYRHLSIAVKVRKDCKKYYKPEEFISMDIAPAVAALQRFTDMLRASRALVINYYSEYLYGAHLKSLQPLFMKCTTTRVSAVGQVRSRNTPTHHLHVYTPNIYTHIHVLIYTYTIFTPAPFAGLGARNFPYGPKTCFSG